MTKDGEGKCPFSGGSQHTVGARSSKRWWPNQLNLKPLHQNSSLPDPMGEDFDYGAEFQTIDLEELKKLIMKRIELANRRKNEDKKDGKEQKHLKAD